MGDEDDYDDMLGKLGRKRVSANFPLPKKLFFNSNMKYVANVLLSIEQPAHKIPILIDYDAVPVHAPQRVT